jgi:hypothetical protein
MTSAGGSPRSRSRGRSDPRGTNNRVVRRLTHGGPESGGTPPDDSGIEKVAAGNATG